MSREQISAPSAEVRFVLLRAAELMSHAKSPSGMWEALTKAAHESVAPVLREREEIAFATAFPDFRRPQAMTDAQIIAALRAAAGEVAS